MNRNDILWVAVGETGGKIVSKILEQDRRNLGLFINTNYGDFSKLHNVKENNIYLIPNASGTGRSREKAKEFAKEYFPSIIDAIKNFRTQKVIYLVYAFSGGTGSGLAPTIAKLLERALPDRMVNIVGVLPSLDEPKRAIENALHCWNETIKTNHINTFYFLDNEKRKNVEEINEEFAIGINKVMNISSQIGSGTVIDAEDLSKVQLAKGCGVFYELPTNENDTKLAIAKAFKNSIFADLTSKRCSYLCTSLQEDKFDANEIKREFLPKDEAFTGYNDSDNLVVAGGFKFPINAVELLQARLEELLDKEADEDEDNIDNYVVNIKPKKKVQGESTSESKKIDKKPKEEKDMDKLFDEDFWKSVF